MVFRMKNGTICLLRYLVGNCKAALYFPLQGYLSTLPQSCVNSEPLSIYENGFCALWLVNCIIIVVYNFQSILNKINH